MQNTNSASKFPRRKKPFQSTSNFQKHESDPFDHITQARGKINPQHTHFLCTECNSTKPLKKDSGGTGYAVFGQENRLVCYDCCGNMDKKDMIEKGTALLYLTSLPVNFWKVSNWPDTISFPATVKKSWHNMAGKDGRRDVWFTGPDGKNWHGYNIGDSQVTHCRRLKH